MTTKKIIPIKQITAWSYSRYSLYKQCPLKLKLTAIDKLKEPGSAAMERGNLIHGLAEQYIKGISPAKLPPELALFKDEFKILRTMYKKQSETMVCEDNWAFTSDWDETSWNDWANCWVRIKLDLAHHEDHGTLIVTDFKTGKFRVEQNEDYVEQLELYALAALLLHPHLTVVKPRLMYLDSGTLYPSTPEDIKRLTFTPADVPRLKAAWSRRVAPMLKDTAFAPRANQYCSWCHFGQSGKAKGGPGLCKF